MSDVIIPVAAYLIVKLQTDGRLVVEGNCHDEKFALQMLDQARDAVRGHHDQMKIVVPASDSDLDDLVDAENEARGAISGKPRLLS